MYLSAGESFQESIDIDQLGRENLAIILKNITNNVIIKEVIIVHDYTNKNLPFMHNILINGMIVGYLKNNNAKLFYEKKKELHIESTLIYSKIKIIKDKNNDVSALFLDMPPMELIDNVLSKRSLLDSSNKFLKLKNDNF